MYQDVQIIMGQYVYSNDAIPLKKINNLVADPEPCS
jgi:hypothetical protein